MPDRYRLLIENLPDTYAYHQIVIDNDGVPVDYIFLEVNTAFEEMTGLTRDCVIGKKITEILPDIKESSFDWIGTYGRVALTGESVRFEQYYLPLERWYEVTAYSDEPGYFAAVFRDTTAYKQMQEKLQSEKNELTAILEEMMDTAAIWIDLLDVDGNVLFWNKAAEQVSGYTAEEVTGHALIWDWLYPDPEYRAEIFAQSQEIIRQGIMDVNAETRIRRKDGQYRTISWHSNNLIENGKVIGSIALGADITERIQAVEALHESKKKLQASEENYRLLVNNTPDHIYSFDREFRLTAVNQGLCRALGLEDSELIGKKISELGFPEDLVREWEKQLHKVFSTGKVVSAETTIPMPDGTVHTYESVLMPVFEENGVVISIRGTNRDISERKKMEQEILRADKLESIGILAGGIAHDFNNYLAVLLGNTTLAKLFKDDSKKVLEILERIEQATIRAKDLANQLFTFAKGAAPVKKTVSVNQLMMDNIGFTLSGSNVGCDFMIDENLYLVDLDEGQFSQVLNNIVINALQAMPGGGVIVVAANNMTLKTDNQTSIPLPEGRYVRISIKDEGIGIPEKYLHKIFDPFFSTKQRGSGLGLATAYSIIKNHGGYISVESEIGVGTTFLLYLPASTRAATTAAAAEKLFFGTGKILVMDDQKDFLEVMEDSLAACGYDVLQAGDGGEAIDIYLDAKKKGRPFDLVITDLTIPGGMGGKETIAELLKKDPQVKAIVASGYVNDPVMANYRDYGFKGVITKPFGIAELSKLVYEVINIK